MLNSISSAAPDREQQVLTQLVETYQGPAYPRAGGHARRADAAITTRRLSAVRSLDAYRGDGANFTGWVHR
jgi:hypothetical protein